MKGRDKRRRAKMRRADEPKVKTWNYVQHPTDAKTSHREGAMDARTAVTRGKSDLAPAMQLLDEFERIGASVIKIVEGK